MSSEQGKRKTLLKPERETAAQTKPRSQKATPEGTTGSRRKKATSARERAAGDSGAPFRPSGRRQPELQLPACSAAAPGVAGQGRGTGDGLGGRGILRPARPPSAALDPETPALARALVVMCSHGTTPGLTEIRDLSKR